MGGDTVVRRTACRSARYNPLLEVWRGEHEVRDVQNIADILVDPEGALERRNHWEKNVPQPGQRHPARSLRGEAAHHSPGIERDRSRQSIERERKNA